MAIYIRINNQDSLNLDPTSFRLAKAGVDVFTTFRTHLLGQKLGIIRPDLHLQRLIEGANILGIQTDLTKQDYYSWLIDILKQTIAADYKENNSTQRIRIILRSNSDLEIYIDNYSKSWDEKIKLLSFKAKRTVASIKHTDFDICERARDYALTNGADEALLVEDYVLEGAWSNIFWHNHKGELCTTKSDILPGVTRTILSEILNVKFENITLEDLKKCSDIFVTQSTTGITTVVEIDNKTINYGYKIGEIKTAYQKYAIENISEIKA